MGLDEKIASDLKNNKKNESKETSKTMKKKGREIENKNLGFGISYFVMCVSIERPLFYKQSFMDKIEMNGELKKKVKKDVEEEVNLLSSFFF